MSEHSAIEPRLRALKRVLETMSQCVRDLDRLGAPIGAARLEHACEAVREEFDNSSGESTGGN